jgi:MFS family permease
MKSKTLWNPQYLFILLCCTLVSIIFYALTPLLSEYTTNQLGSTLTIAGVISGLFSITSLLVRPFSGILSDRMDLKKLCLTSTLLLGLTTIAYLFAEDILILASIRILNGFAYAFCSTSCFVLLSRYIPFSNLNEGIGYYGVGQIISSALGLTLGIQLSHHNSFTSNCLILGCLLLLIAGALLTIRFPA